MTGLFSGRFDPAHPGHLITIADLLIKFDKLLVPVLSYRGREACTARESVAIMDGFFDRVMSPMLRNKLVIFVNKHHFGRITKAQLQKYPKFDIYLSGNRQVLDHMKSLGYKTRRVKRIPADIRKKVKVDLDKMYSGTEVRRILSESGRPLSSYYHLNLS